MRTYKRKSERGNISKDVYEQAAVILEEDKTKKVRGVAKDFGLCHMSLTRFLKKRKEAKEKGTPLESVTMGYKKNRQVFNDKQEAVLLKYPSGAIASQGNELTPTQVKEQPSVSFNADPNSFYTLVFTDPDNYDGPEPVYREWHHWLVVNIPGSDVSKGEVLSGYIGSGPPAGTGIHRYVYIAYKQPSKLEFDEKRLTNKSIDGRAAFSTKKFAEKYNLGAPVAGNFYRAQFDDYVPLLYKSLGV